MAITAALHLGSSQMAFPPRSYWRFEEADDFGVDSAVTKHNLTISVCKEGLFRVENGDMPIVGSYLGLLAGNTISTSLSAASGSWNCSFGCPGITFEALVRPGRFFNFAGQTNLFTATGEGSAFHTAVLLGRHSLGFHAGNHPGFPDVVVDAQDVVVPLDGIGLASYTHLLDGAWHHLAFRKRSESHNNVTVCFVDIFVDGALPAGFN
eukprot:gene10190-9015_t